MSSSPRIGPACGPWSRHRSRFRLRRHVPCCATGARWATAPSDLSSLELDPGGAQPVDRTIDLRLAGGMMSSAWTINGQAYPDADPIDLHLGERVEFRMFNQSNMRHPMHLHGHFFRVGRALKDT